MMKVSKIKTLEQTPIEKKVQKVSPLPKEAQEDIRKAIETMRKGGVILYPTDTVWGLGCDATNEEAVRKVYAIKHREDCKALITLVDSEPKLNFYIRQVPAIAWDLIELSTRPTTIIYDKSRNLAPNLVAEDGSAGIRVTQEQFSRELCFRFHQAIVSTSANISGEPTPQNFSEISEEIKQAVDYIVGYRQNEKAKAQPSSIIKLGAHGEIKIIR